jgi:hypothetical protein
MTLSRGIKPTQKEYEKYIKTDISSITNDYKGRKYVIPRFFIDVMKRKYNMTKPLDIPNSSNFFISMKSSPNSKGCGGQPSIIASLLDTHAIPREIFEGLIFLLGERGEHLFTQMFHIAQRIIEEWPKWKPPVWDLCGRLSVVHDPEGKERVVAILDYWSQWALKPIHDNLLNILKGIPMDRTFTQSPFHDWKDDGNKFWSLDLTSATDRFPLFVQTKIISSIYGKEIGQAWSSILVDREYDANGYDTKYKVGQPMGAYSSWATFALSHHMVVQWAAYLCGIRDFQDYILLGDDIVIKNDIVAQRYIGLMRRWGVEISEAKTHVSPDTYEFAKRWIHQQREISPLPVKGIMEHFKEYKTVLSLINEWHMKTHYVLGTGQSAYQIVKESYKGLFINKQWCTEELMKKRLYDLWIGVSWTSRNILPSELVEWYIWRGWDLDNLTSNDKIEDFTLRVVNKALARVISRAARKVLDTGWRFLKEFSPRTRRSLRYHPLTFALKNTLTNIQKVILGWDNTPESLKDIIKNLAVPGVTELVHLKRQNRSEVSGIDRVWKMIKPNTLIHEDSRYSMNLDGSNPKLVAEWAAECFEQPIGHLDDWCSGKTSKPRIDKSFYIQVEEDLDD